ncbi:hypothetical protein I5080_10160 [Salmonella enterica]|nr:hypothetical protein I5080_10160 [Salmonella enterica]
MLEIVLSPVKAQQFTVTLGAQVCTIRLNQRTTGMYIDITVNGEPCLYGVLCLNNNRIVRYGYLPFQGDLFFSDTEGEPRSRLAGGLVHGTGSTGCRLRI